MKFTKKEVSNRRASNYPVHAWDSNFQYHHLLITSYDRDAVNVICEKMVEAGHWQGFSIASINKTN